MTMTTTTPNIHDYLTTRRAINALRDEQFRILTSRHRDETRYKAIQAEIDALRQKIGWTG
jgi:hypothetical protein